MTQLIEHIFTSGKFTPATLEDHKDVKHLFNPHVDVAFITDGIEFVRAKDEEVATEEQPIIFSYCAWTGVIHEKGRKYLPNCTHASVILAFPIPQSVLDEMHANRVPMIDVMRQYPMFVCISSGDYEDTMKEYMTTFTGSIDDIPEGFKPVGNVRLFYGEEIENNSPTWWISTGAVL